MEELIAEYYNVRNKILEKVTEYINKQLKEHNGFLPLDYNEYEYPYVVYNGGNHPEYASGYLSAHSIYLYEGKDVVVELEEGKQQYFEEFNFEDVLNLYEFVKGIPWDKLALNKYEN